MNKLRTVVRKDEAEKMLKLVEGGNGRVFREAADGVTETVITTKSGTAICAIGKNYRYMFDEFVSAHGAGDGLFPGFSQTAAL